LRVITDIRHSHIFATRHTMDGSSQTSLSRQSVALVFASCNQYHNNRNFCNGKLVNDVTKEAQNTGVERHNKTFVIPKTHLGVESDPQSCHEIFV